MKVGGCYGAAYMAMFLAMGLGTSAAKTSFFGSLQAVVCAGQVAEMVAVVSLLDLEKGGSVRFSKRLWGEKIQIPWTFDIAPGELDFRCYVIDTFVSGITCVVARQFKIGTLAAAALAVAGAFFFQPDPQVNWKRTKSTLSRSWHLGVCRRWYTGLSTGLLGLHLPPGRFYGFCTIDFDTSRLFEHARLAEHHYGRLRRSDLRLSTSVLWSWMVYLGRNHATWLRLSSLQWDWNGNFSKQSIDDTVFWATKARKRSSLSG